MVYGVVLVLHIIASVLTGVAIAYVLYNTARGKSANYRASALALGSIAGFQIFSGTILTVLSPELTAASLVPHMALYLGVCLAVEALLFIRAKNISLVLPLGRSLSPMFASVVIFAAAVSYGL